MFENFSINKYKYYTFPKSGSIKQLKEVIELDNTPLDVSFANKFDNIASVFENIFIKRQLEFPHQLVKKLINETNPIIKSIKNYHDRERPNVAATRFGMVLPYFEMDSAKTPAFPSGHSAQAVLIAKVLSDLHPRMAVELNQAANNISNSRLKGRVHYKSDSEAGIKIGNDLYEHYKKTA